MPVEVEGEVGGGNFVSSGGACELRVRVAGLFRILALARLQDILLALNMNPNLYSR